VVAVVVLAWRPRGYLVPLVVLVLLLLPRRKGKRRGTRVIGTGMKREEEPPPPRFRRSFFCVCDILCLGGKARIVAVFGR
jgi:hypothetical protein